MKNKRRFERFPTQREAQIFLREGKEWGQECTIINVSRKGVGILFRTSEKIDVGAHIRLEVPDPLTTDIIGLRGQLKWSREIGDRFVGGVELHRILGDVKFSKLA